MHNLSQTQNRTRLKIEVSARHLHLTRADFEELFGSGQSLTELKKLSQGRQFAAQETVDLKTQEGEIKGVRIVGPFRDYTQIEISKSDAVSLLKVKPPLRLSGRIQGSLGCGLQGPQGKIDLKQGLIIAQRHLHLSPEKAQALNLKAGDWVKARIRGERGLVFEKIIVRVKPDWSCILHLDTDEGNAAGIEGVGEGDLII